MKTKQENRSIWADREELKSDRPVRIGRKEIRIARSGTLKQLEDLKKRWTVVRG